MSRQVSRLNRALNAFCLRVLRQSEELMKVPAVLRKSNLLIIFAMFKDMIQVANHL
jgi:hypothetical protein